MTTSPAGQCRPRVTIITARLCRKTPAASAAQIQWTSEQGQGARQTFFPKKKDIVTLCVILGPTPEVSWLLYCPARLLSSNPRDEQCIARRDVCGPLCCSPALSCWPPRQRAAAAPRAALVTAARGDIEYQHGGVGPFLPLGLHASLSPGDVVRTGADGEAELLFLSDGSSVKVDSRHHPADHPGAANPAGENKSLLQVILGVFWAHLRPGTDIGAPGHTNTVTHGTEVLVAVADDGTTTLTVVEGDVTFSNPLGAQN